MGMAGGHHWFAFRTFRSVLRPLEVRVLDRLNQLRASCSARRGARGTRGNLRNILGDTQPFNEFLLNTAFWAFISGAGCADESASKESTTVRRQLGLFARVLI